MLGSSLQLALLLSTALLLGTAAADYRMGTDADRVPSEYPMDQTLNRVSSQYAAESADADRVSSQYAAESTDAGRVASQYADESTDADRVANGDNSGTSCQSGSSASQSAALSNTVRNLVEDVRKLGRMLKHNKGISEDERAENKLAKRFALHKHSIPDAVLNELQALDGAPHSAASTSNLLLPTAVLLSLLLPTAVLLSLLH